MRTTLLLATLSMVFVSPKLSAQSELESLRARCAEQERQIAQLEQENSNLRAATATSLPPSVPTETSSEATSPTSPTNAPSAEPTAAYTVKSGDNLEKIARKTGTSVANLIKWNRLKSNSIIQPGQSLKTAQATATTSAPAANESATTAPGKSYQIQNGDTFSSIARSHNISVASLIAANPRVKPSALRIGQTIQLGSADAASTSPTTAESSPEPTTPAPSSPQSTAAALIPNITQPATAIEEAASTTEDQKFKTVTIEAEMTFGEFASKYETDIARLNALNGLDLINTTVLAKGSELYVPAQP